MKIILQELRKDIQKSALEVPVKKRVKKVEPAKAVVEEVSAVVEEVSAVVEEVSAVVEAVIEPEPPIEQTAASSEALPPRGELALVPKRDSPSTVGASGSTVEPPKTVKKRKTPVSKKVK